MILWIKNIFLSILKNLFFWIFFKYKKWVFFLSFKKCILKSISKIWKSVLKNYKFKKLFKEFFWNKMFCWKFQLKLSLKTLIYVPKPTYILCQKSDTLISKSTTEHNFSGVWGFWGKNCHFFWGLPPEKIGVFGTYYPWPPPFNQILRFTISY